MKIDTCNICGILFNRDVVGVETNEAASTPYEYVKCPNCKAYLKVEELDV